MGARAAEKKSGGLIREADEMRSFVGNKRSQWWIWAAPDAGTRQVVAVVAGDRSEKTARDLGDALPPEYRAAAAVRTDFWAAYAAVVPAAQHEAGGKGAGITGHVERFWCTVRQRCSRYVRKALSFSKCFVNHVGALWYFIRAYNASRL